MLCNDKIKYFFLNAILVFCFFNESYASSEKDRAGIEKITKGEDPLEEIKSKKGPNKLGPYKKNFILPVYYTDSPDNAFYQHENPNRSSISNTEMKFQFSVKYPIFTNVFGERNRLYVAYTQLSYWQAYQDSAFFRESDYSPEIFLRFRHDDHYLLGWKAKKTDIGFVHESNGMGGDLERGWNRIFISQKLSRNDWDISLMLWYRVSGLSRFGIHEYNPTITDYLGHGLLTLKRTQGNQIYSIELRNQINSGFSKGAEILTWSYRLKNNISVFIQGFSGYGQSLGEYDHYTNSIGIGFGFSH